jgi:hypothetical protein
MLSLLAVILLFGCVSSPVCGDGTCAADEQCDLDCDEFGGIVTKQSALPSEDIVGYFLLAITGSKVDSLDGTITVSWPKTSKTTGNTICISKGGDCISATDASAQKKPIDCSAVSAGGNAECTLISGVKGVNWSSSTTSSGAAKCLTTDGCIKAYSFDGKALDCNTKSKGGAAICLVLSDLNRISSSIVASSYDIKYWDLNSSDKNDFKSQSGESLCVGATCVYAFDSEEKEVLCSKIMTKGAAICTKATTGWVKSNFGAAINPSDECKKQGGGECVKAYTCTGKSISCNTKSFTCGTYQCAIPEIATGDSPSCKNTVKPANGTQDYSFCYYYNLYYNLRDKSVFLVYNHNLGSYSPFDSKRVRENTGEHICFKTENPNLDKNVNMLYCEKAFNSNFDTVDCNYSPAYAVACRVPTLKAGEVGVNISNSAGNVYVPTYLGGLYNNYLDSRGKCKYVIDADSGKMLKCDQFVKAGLVVYDKNNLYTFKYWDLKTAHPSDKWWERSTGNSASATFNEAHACIFAFDSNGKEVSCSTSMSTGAVLFGNSVIGRGAYNGSTTSTQKYSAKPYCDGLGKACIAAYDCYGNSISCTQTSSCLTFVCAK